MQYRGTWHIMFRILPSPCCFPRHFMNNSRYSATCQQYPGGTLPWFLWWFKQTSCSYAVISWPSIVKPHLLAFAYYLLLSCHYHPRLFLPTAKSYQQNTQSLVPGSAWVWYQVSCTGALPLGLRTDMLLLKAVPNSGWQRSSFVPCWNRFLSNTYTLPMKAIEGRKGKTRFISSSWYFWSVKNTEDKWTAERMFYYFMSCWLWLLS